MEYNTLFRLARTMQGITQAKVGASHLFKIIRTLQGMKQTAIANRIGIVFDRNSPPQTPRLDGE
jgi:hypothetical protein